MSTAIEKSIIQKVRDFLGVENEYNAIELYDVLHQYCDEINPAGFGQDENKAAAEKRLIEARELLSGLAAFIEGEAAQKSPAQLLLQKPTYDRIFLRQALDNARAEVEKLKKDVKWRDGQIEDLNSQLKKRDDLRFQDERRRLEKMYKPTSRNLASLGIIFLLSALLATMSKVKEVSDFISQYSPFSETFMKTTLFAILLVIVILTLKRYIENLSLRRKVEDICSAQFSAEFMSYLSARSEGITKAKKFAESDVFYFVAGKQRKWKILLAHIGFPIFQTRTYELLKNHFINHLLQRELIEISVADGLDRIFTIRSTTHYW